MLAARSSSTRRGAPPPGSDADNVQVDLVLAPFEGRTPQTRTFSVKTMQLDVVQDIIKQPA